MKFIIKLQLGSQKIFTRMAIFHCWIILTGLISFLRLAFLKNPLYPKLPKFDEQKMQNLTKTDSDWVIS